MQSSKPFDIFIIGGGINGCGIARDAAGRGLSVCLVEMGDLASATSSASTKLFHGGLRYLEYFEIGLVRKALIEREVLLKAMPHISRPMRFVLPYHPDMRFEGETPTSRLLNIFMPWMKGRRPAWLIRLGLFLYDNLGGRQILPGTATLDLAKDPAGRVLKPKFRRAYEYSDCWVDDARLVVLNARDAADRGASILTRAKATEARRVDGLWEIDIDNGNARQTLRAKCLVNAGGPWVEAIVRQIAHVDTKESIRLVRGSHIVVPKLFDHGKSYFFQGQDGRIIFAIPYEEDFTLIGTTDMDHQDDPAHPVCTTTEQDYLCAFASDYFAKPVNSQDVVWTYSGVRPLYNDHAKSAQAATRDYVLSLNADGAPILSVFGGKITTYRKLAEAALDKIVPFLSPSQGHWTAGVPLAGGRFAVTEVGALVDGLSQRHPYLDAYTCRRLIRSYGTEAQEIFAEVKTAAQLGHDFGAGLFEPEVRWLVAREFARNADDVVWRRSKLGLRMTRPQIDALEDWMLAQGKSA